MKTKILDQIRGSEQGMLQLLEELVNIDSGADALAGINAVAQRIGAFLEVLGFTVEYLETDGAPVQLLARKVQPGKKQVLFSGHMDTVFNQGTAAVRPFKVENGRAYGPGVLDMKGGMVMALYVIRALLENGWQETDMPFYCAVMKKCHILLLMRWHSSKKRAQGRMLFLIWNLDALTAASLRAGRELPGQRW